MLTKTYLLGVAGFIICIIGFFLTPFIIGIPIMMVGWLLLLFNTFARLINLIVPKRVQEQVVRETLEGYKPYEPAIQSLAGIVWDMVKVATLIALSVISGLMLLSLLKIF